MASRRGHRPQRTCIGCGQRDEQEKLIRLVAETPDRLRIERIGPGRGGYLHRSPACWQAFIKRKSVYRAFRKEIKREVREQLVRELSDRQWE